MNEATKQLLAKLGLSATQIDELASAGEEFDVQPIFTAVRSNQKELLENDQEFMDNLEGTMKARVNSELKRKFKREYGLTSDDIPDDAGFDDLIKLAKEREDQRLKQLYEGQTEEKYKSDLESMQNVLAKRTQELDELKEEKIPNLIKQHEKQFSQFRVSQRLADRIKELPTTLSRPEILVKEVMAQAEAKDLQIVEQNGDLTLLRSDGKRPTLDDNSDFLSLDTYLSKTLKDWGALKVSNAADGNPGGGGSSRKPGSSEAAGNNGGVGSGNPGGGTPSNLPGLNKAMANASRQKSSTE